MAPLYFHQSSTLENKFEKNIFLASFSNENVLRVPNRLHFLSMYGQLSSGDLGLISILSSVYALTLHMRDTKAQVQV